MPERALLIVDHGSRRPEAHAHLEWLADEVRRAGEVAVYIAHLELAEPSIQQAVDACAADGVRQLFVHPLFLAPGRHLSEDVPGLVASAASRHPGLAVRITPALGTRRDLARIILDTLD